LLLIISAGGIQYLGFFSDIAEQVSGWHSGFVKLALPLGISFFLLFTNIIYLADLLRVRAPGYSFRNYSLSSHCSRKFCRPFGTAQ